MCNYGNISHLAYSTIALLYTALDSILIFFPSIEADNMILLLLVTFRIVGTFEYDGVHKKTSNIPSFPFAPRVSINIQALLFLILKFFLLLGSIRSITIEFIGEIRKK